MIIDLTFFNFSVVTNQNNYVENWNGDLPRSIFLAGVPGVGKSMLTNVMAAHYDYEVMRIHCNGLFSMWQGE